MKQYTIFANPLGQYEAVKQGWSWPAFFFGWIWALVKKMWGIGAAVLGGMIVFSFFTAVSNSSEGGVALLNVISIVINAVFGFNGNKWRENHLPTRGYERLGTVAASTPEGAVAAYIKEHQ